MPRRLNFATYVLLLLVYMVNLEPNVGVREGIGWVAEDAVKALEALCVLALLLVDDAQAEEDLVRLVEV